MRILFAVLVTLLTSLTLAKSGRRSAGLLRSVTKLLFVTTQLCALAWVFTSYGIAIYSTVHLQQVQTLAELSEPAIRTILGVSVLKVVENIFEHNDSKIFGESKKESPPGNGGEEVHYYDESV